MYSFFNLSERRVLAFFIFDFPLTLMIKGYPIFLLFDDSFFNTQNIISFGILHWEVSIFFNGLAEEFVVKKVK